MLIQERDPLRSFWKQYDCFQKRPWRLPKWGRWGHCFELRKNLELEQWRREQDSNEVDINPIRILQQFLVLLWGLGIESWGWPVNWSQRSVWIGQPSSFKEGVEATGWFQRGTNSQGRQQVHLLRKRYSWYWVPGRARRLIHVFRNLQTWPLLFLCQYDQRTTRCDVPQVIKIVCGLKFKRLRCGFPLHIPRLLLCLGPSLWTVL